MFFLLCLVAPFSMAQVTQSLDTYKTRHDTVVSTQVIDERSDLLNLSPEEWEEHQHLVQNLRQYLSDESISPLEVLGIHAPTTQKRSEYAKRWAQIVYEDTQRVLMFQHAFDQAMEELIGNQPLIDVQKLPSKSDSQAILKTDRILLFVEIDCFLCSDAIGSILERLDIAAGLDIYFVNQADEADIGLWANQHGINPLDVEQGRVTLNMDLGTLERVYPRAGQVPVLLRLRDGIPSPISLAELGN